MPRTRLMDLEWAFDDINFEMLALTEGAAPGGVSWGPTSEQDEAARAAIGLLLGEGKLTPKKSRSVEDLVLRRDEDLVGVAILGRQVLLVGTALPTAASHTSVAVARAVADGLEFWNLGFFEVYDGVMYARQGRLPGRYVALSSEELETSGDPLPFERALWDGSTAPTYADDDPDGEHDDEPLFEELLARAALTNWMSTEGELDRFLETPLAVYKARWSH